MNALRPDIIPIFPLPGVLLLPGGCLPLNIFEPRYLAMTQDALGSHRLIGMIQPRGGRMPCGTPYVHEVGCAGQIGRERSTSDGRLLLELTGTARFRILEELPPLRGYRQVRVQWLEEGATQVQFDRARLLPALRRYLVQRQLECNWAKLQGCADSRILVILAMVCPFSPAEKQALLEAPDAETRGRILTGLIEMADVPCSGRPN